ncbi:MAG: hypothetical protein ACXVX8_18185 [Blastococcus sp.]
MTATIPAAPSTATRRTGLAGALARRWPTGLSIVATTVTLAVLAPFPERIHTSVTAWGVLTAAVIYLAWGTARGELDARRWLTAQTVGVLAFGAVAITAVGLDPSAASYVLTAGWLAHAAWDVVHHHADRVVPRWYAELCMVSDLLIVTALLTLHTV